MKKFMIVLIACSFLANVSLADDTKLFIAVNVNTVGMLPKAVKDCYPMVKEKLQHSLNDKKLTIIITAYSSRGSNKYIWWKARDSTGKTAKLMTQKGLFENCF